MFSLTQYMNEKPENDTFVIRIGEEEYKIRRLDGIDLIRLQDLEETEKKLIHILATCLLDGDTNSPVGTNAAIQFLRNDLSVAIEIINKIIDLTEEIQQVEKMEFENAKKNS